METYFTTEELAAYLKVAEQSIRRWVLNNEVPYHRIHNVIRFRLSEIERWVDGHTEKAPALEDGTTDGELSGETETAGTGDLDGDAP
jgi:excisionase family DNA binding protein